MKELEPYLKAGTIDALDLSIAKMLLKNEKNPKVEWAFFLCHLSKSFRSGRLSIEISGNTLSPSSDLLWKNEKGIPLPKTGAALEDIIIRGSNLPDNPYLVKEAGHTYFLRAYLSLELFLDALQGYLAAKKETIKEISVAFEVIHEAKEKGLLGDKQKEACLAALESPITLILGGPGTGKTYTAAHIVSALKKAHAGLKIAVAAPTGKAASNLKSALEKIATYEIDEPKTLHSLLNLPYKSKAIKAPYQLGHDLFIIDEASMIDMDMMSALLKSMKPTSRLILLGDPDQLPPIDLGSPFSDIAEATDLPKGLRKVTLDTCMRCESLEVLDLSKKILEGNSAEIAGFFKEKKGSIELIEIDSAKPFALQEEIVSLALKKYEPMILRPEDPEFLFACQKAFSILTPFRIGHLGSEALNALISSKIYRYYEDKTLALPIMIKENRADLGLYNGDLGFLVVDKENKTGLFLGSLSQKHRSIPHLLLPQYEYAFCLSIHKSQGSEFEEALLLIPEGSEGFGKKILYTALTRVKKRALIYSNIDLFCLMASQSPSKNSAVANKLLSL